MNADFGKTADDYRKHRAGFPTSFFQALQEGGLINGSERILDIGTGTGTVARGLAELGCKVIGMDPSADMLSAANMMATERGLEVDWRVGSAEDTGLVHESVDVVTAGQCWHWFDHPRVIKEVNRILKPGGLIVIAHFDWLPIEGNVVWQTEQLIMEANPNWEMGGQIGVYPDWFRHLYAGDFRDVKSFSYYEPVDYSHDAWRGRIRASAGVGGSMSKEDVLKFDSDHKKMLEVKFPDEPLCIPHQVFVIHGRK